MKKLLLIIVTIFSILSCADLKEAQDNIADLQNRVESLETQLQALKTAFETGKIIKEVKAFENEGRSGWEILFNDNSSIFIYDVADAITPILDINQEGYWEVSYDNGETFTLILGADGKPIQSKGDKGDEAVSLRIVVGNDGKYVIESYYTSKPDEVIESIKTPYSSNSEACIASIVKDPDSETIKLVMSDGTEYLFNLDVLYPTGIVVLAESLPLAKEGTSSFMFRVNPSNAVVKLDLDVENPMFELDLAVDHMTRSYVTAPAYYELEKIESVTDADGNRKEGQYKAYVKDLGVSDNYSQGVTLVLNTKDGAGNPVQISSDILKIRTADKPEFISLSVDGNPIVSFDDELISVRFAYGTDVTALPVDFSIVEGTVTANGTEIKPNDKVDFSSPVEFTVTDLCGCSNTYIVCIAYSDLPVVYINTKDAAEITSKETWIKGTDIYLTNAGEHTRLYSEAQIRGRGNTTWGYPKKPYAIKLDSKEEVLGMPKHKRWVLLANYLDKTCIRNSIAYEIARRSSGLDWTPRGQHVDVVLNGNFLGNYFLCEQIKIDKNRVNISEMESTDIDEVSITGGYLLEIDRNFDEVNKFLSPFRQEPAPYPLPYMVKEPDEETLATEQFNWIYNHIYEVEKSLYGEGSTTEGYLQYIDLDSFIDYWLVYEITGTGEPTHPKSVYMWKDRGGKIHAGPVWDFDYFTFNPYYQEKLINTNAIWNDRIINDPANRAAIKARWEESREKYRTIAEEITRQYEYVKESAEYNATLWPVDPAFYVPNINNDPNREKDLTVDQAVERMKSYYQAKFEYMDTYINTNF